MKDVDEYRKFLAAVTDVNVRYLKRFPNTPPISEAGKHTQDHCEAFRCLPNILNAGGDVDDLACWLVAELRAKDIQAEIVIRGEPGKWLTCFVKLPDGVLLDPLQMVQNSTILMTSGGKPPTSK